MKRHPIRYVIYLILGLILASVLFFFVLLKIPSVQNWAVDYLSDLASERLRTTITIGHVDFDITNRLEIDELYIQDLHGDTMVYVRKFETDLARSLLTILGNKAYIQSITLEDAVIDIHTLKDEKKSNWASVFETKPDADSSAVSKESKWDFKLAKIFFKNSRFRIENQNKGSLQEIEISSAALILNPNMESEKIEIKTIDVDGLAVNIEKWQTEQEENKTMESSDDQDNGDTQDSFLILVRNLDLRNAALRYWDRDAKQSPGSLRQETIDFKHLELTDIQLSLHNIQLSDHSLLLQAERLSARTNSGFELRNFSAEQLYITPTKAALVNTSIRTKNSWIRRNMVLSYPSFDAFNSFVDQVHIDVDLANSQIALDEILHFVPSLSENEFIKKNHRLKAYISGHATGKINKMQLKDFDLRVADDIVLRGNISVKDLTKPSQTRLHLNLDEFRSNVTTIHKLIPSFKPPKEYYQIGDFVFQGRFDGYYKDFVAFGDLKTDLGEAQMNMKLDLANSFELAKYTGTMHLTGFDLGAWTANQDLGKFSGEIIIKDGRGLTRQSAQALIDARITDFTYKDYLYRDIRLKGNVQEGVLDGRIKIDDPNLNFDFSGSLDFSTDSPSYDFTADIVRIDLRKLHLTDRQIVIKGKADFNATNLSLEEMDGDFVFSDFQLMLDDTASFAFDTVHLISTFTSGQEKTLEVDSDVLYLNMEGRFLLDKMHITLLRLLEKNYADFYKRLGMRSYLDGIAQADQHFDFYLNIKNSKGLTTALHLPLDTIRDFQVDGSYYDDEGYLRWTSYTDYLKMEDIEFFGLGVNSEQADGVLTADLAVDRIVYADKYVAKSFNFEQRLTADSLYFNLNTGGLEQVIENLNIGGRIFLEGEHFGLRLDAQDLAILNELWHIDPDNKTLFSKNFIRSEKVFLTNGKEYFYFNTQDDQGVEIGTKNFDLDLLNDLWVYDKLTFEGPFEFKVKNDNVFELENFEANVHMDSLWINRDYYGLLDITTQMRGIKMPIDINLVIDDVEKDLTASGVFIPRGFGKPAATADMLDVQIILDNYPAKMVEYWIGEGVENTKGHVDVKLNINGPMSNLQMNGLGKLKGVETKVIYLGTTYKTSDAQVKISSNLLDVTGGELIDKYGNRAQVTGGLTHNLMRDIGLDVSVHGQHFLALDTDKYHGEAYYGHAIGEMDVRFDGLIDAPNIRIEGKPTTGTKLFIPLEESIRDEEVSFVAFDHQIGRQKEAEERAERLKIKGVNIHMDLDVDSRSEIKIIMDEQESNVITGRGNGNFKILMNRSGDFNIYGDYIVQSGDYIYSYQDFVPRRFAVNRGGTIRWTGDPFNAQMDITADYVTSTSIYTFVEEFFPTNANSQLRDEARRNQRVKVIMLIDGPLLKPNINFDLQFPNLPSGQLGNYITAKVNSLQSEPNLLNMQVFGLLLTGGFLPETNLVSSIINTENAFNTVTDFITSQLSQYISQLLSDAITDISFVSDFNLQFNYRQYRDIIANQNDEIYQVNPEIGLFEGKILLTGGAYFINSQGVNGSYVANDFKFEYNITSDGRFKVRVYQLSDLELGSRKIEVGVGLRYSKTFDRLLGKKPEDEE